MKCIKRIDKARELLEQGQVIAYPTEAVFGLGCDPYNPQAIEKLYALKGRSLTKGVILLISSWEQLPPLIQPISFEVRQKLKETWPGHVTWIFPKSLKVPTWITGGEPTIAIRMTAHPIASELCAQQPIVSTSANLSGQAPARSIEEVQKQFPEGLTACIDGELGKEARPSRIYDALTGKQLR